MPREQWTDERLDDLNKKVDDGFARLDKDIRELRTDMNSRFNGLGEPVQGLESRFEGLESRFDGLNRTLIGGFFVLIAAVIGSNAFYAQLQAVAPTQRSRFCSCISRRMSSTP